MQAIRALPWALGLALGLASCTPPPRSRQPASPPGISAAPVGDASSASAEPEVTGPSVRPSALAGSWYPDGRALVTAEVGRLFREASSAPALGGQPVALVVPHAGWEYSGAAAAAAYRSLHRGQFERVVLLGPSHHGSFAGFALRDVGAYATPLGEVPLCPAAKGLADGTLVRPVPGVDAPEHSIEIQLPFLQARLGSFCLVPILVGQTDPAMERTLAERLAALRDGHTLFVFSSDFVHYGPRYGYTPFGPSAERAHDRIAALENRAIAMLERPDVAGFRRLVDETGATICGRNGLAVLLELLGRMGVPVHPVLLAHYASSELPGADDPNAVGYVSLAFVEGAPSATTRAKPFGPPAPPVDCAVDSPPLATPLGEALVRVARATLQTELAGTDDLARALDALPSAPELDRRQAVFVTLQKGGLLRGCVGQIEAEYELPQAVVHAALDAALHDSRFDPVRAAELGQLTVEVTALSPPRRVGSWRDIELGKHGIILQIRRQGALFLPQVATEQGWTLEQTLDALSRKAGLPEGAWRGANAQFAVFTGQVFHEAAAPPRGAPSED